MHQIEEILKKLNEQSATLQPGTVQLLTHIQDRLMHRSASHDGNEQPIRTEADERPESRADLVAFADRRTVSVPEAANRVPHTQAPASSSGHPQETISPLLQSIMESNRRIRRDGQQSAQQPRFLSAAPVRNAVAPASPSTHWQTEPTYVVDHGSEVQQWYASTLDSTYPESLSESSTNEIGRETAKPEWPVAETYPEKGQFFDLARQESPGEPAATLPLPSRTAENGYEIERLPVATPSVEDPTHRSAPAPHFGTSNADRTTAESLNDQALPIFDSVWFRRNAPNHAIEAIVDQILEKVPPVAPATLQFTQSITSQAEGHLITTRIAWELARRVPGDVLLVDGDFLMREISRQLENVYLPGLGDMLNLGESSAALIRKTGVDHLYWLPSGRSDVSFRNTRPEQWSKISAELKKRFQYVCIFAGPAEEKVASTWGRFCDFTFLMASMTDQLGDDTQRMLDRMRQHDCRISGLITVD